MRDARCHGIIKPANAEIHPRQRCAMRGSTETIVPVVCFGIVVLCGCEGLVPHDGPSLLIPKFQRWEIFGFIAGLGTTFAAVPDMLVMLTRRLAGGIYPKMPAIMGAFRSSGILRLADCFTAGDRVDGPFLLDVREPVELAVERVPGAANIPLGDLRSRLGDLPRDREILVFCRSGQRAYRATRVLLQHGFRARNLMGGTLSRAMLSL
jgi:rhodanese-related sulfurtransferase